MGDAFSLITAFSREGPNKVYVQHRLEEHAQEINQLLQQGAYFYVCGDAANMAREVNIVLSKIISEERGLTLAQGEEIVKRMRTSNLYQVKTIMPPYMMSVADHLVIFRRMFGHSFPNLYDETTAQTIEL